MLSAVTTRDEALKAVRTAAAARVRAEEKVRAATDAEDRAIQDAADVLDIKVRGTVSAIAHEAQRSGEHVRKVADPRQRRGRHRSTSDA